MDGILTGTSAETATRDWLGQFASAIESGDGAKLAVLFAGTQKALVKVPDNRLNEVVRALYDAIDNRDSGQAYAARFSAKPAMDDELKGLLSKLIEETVKPYRKA